MKTVISLEPDNAEALNYLGYTYADRGFNLEEAEKLIRRAVEIKPDDGYILDSLGWVFFHQGLYAEAVKILERAQAQVPEDPVILEHLGDAYEKAGAYENALSAYKKATEKAKDKELEKLKVKIDDLEERLKDR
jgi:Flp pilus assembly protein TadD